MFLSLSPAAPILLSLKSLKNLSSGEDLKKSIKSTGLGTKENIQRWPLLAMMVVGQLISEHQQEGLSRWPMDLRSPWLILLALWNNLWKLWSLPHLLVNFPLFFFNSPLHFEWGIQSFGFEILAAIEMENASKHHIGNLTVQWITDFSHLSQERKKNKVKVVYKTIKLSSLRSNYFSGIFPILYSFVILILKSI